MSLATACALLAAGSSRRLGRPKQLLPFRGSTLLRVLATQVEQAHFAWSAVVLGASEGTIAEELRGLTLETLVNADPAEGMASSLRLSVRWASERGADALLVCVCDQPLLTALHLRALAAALAEGASAAASVYEGKRGVPAGFRACWFHGLLQLEGDQGARSLLRTSADVRELPWEDGAFDVDTEQALARLAELSDRGEGDGARASRW